MLGEAKLSREYGFGLGLAFLSSEDETVDPTYRSELWKTYSTPFIF